MGLYDNMAKEPVRGLALREPVLVHPSETLGHSVQQMRKRRLGCVIVIDDDQKPVGMFTESMLTQLIAQDAFNPDDKVKQHMSAGWPWVKLTDPIADVLFAMQTKNIRFLCVVGNDGKVAGLTGQKGLMEYVADHFPGQVMVQRIGGQPYPQTREGA